MRLPLLLRLAAFVPPAALISAAILMSASSLVSALESTLTPVASTAIVIERIESRCDELDRKIEALSRAATSCDQDLQCLQSPILCPIAMDERAERDYRALREERHEHCSIPLLRPESSSARFREVSPGTSAVDWRACRSLPNWLESAEQGRTRSPTVFDF
jgi:hypothetical protein